MEAVDHWGKFPSFTEELARLAAFPNTPMVKGSKAAMEECHEARRQLSDYLARSRVLYMRWKGSTIILCMVGNRSTHTRLLETNFINLTSDCGLTMYVPCCVMWSGWRSAAVAVMGSITSYSIAHRESLMVGFWFPMTRPMY